MKDTYRYISSTFIILCFSVCGSLSGQITPLDNHALALGTSSNPTVLTGVHGLYANPATISLSSYRLQGTASGLNRYSTDIYTFSGAAVYRLDASNHLGLSLGSYGISGFKENFATISFSKRIGTSSYLAIQPQISRLDIEGLGQRSVWDITLGYYGQISSSLALSFHVEQIRSFLSSDDRFGQFNLGIGYTLSDITEIYSTIRYTSDNEIVFNPGLLYKPHDILHLYISVGTSPSTISFGTGIDIAEGTQVQLGYQAHPDLGASLGLAITHAILP